MTMHKLSELLQDHQMFHSKFQQDNFITKRAGGTLYGQYKQALRELASRISSLKNAYYTHEKLKIEIAELEDKLQQADKRFFAKPSKFRKAKWELSLKQKLMSLEESSRTIQDIEREFKRFYAQATYLRSRLEAQHGPLTQEVKDRLDEEMWLFKTKEAIAIDFVAHGRLLNTTFEMIVSLPRHMKKRVLEDLKNPSKLIEWYETRDLDYFQGDDLEVITDNVKTLLKSERLLLE